MKSKFLNIEFTEIYKNDKNFEIALFKEYRKHHD